MFMGMHLVTSVFQCAGAVIRVATTTRSNSMSRTRQRIVLALASAAALALAGCGGGSGSSSSAGGGGDAGGSGTALKGVVADGLIQGATVCYDLDDNGRCDAGEPVSSPTGADGGYELRVPADAAGKHAVVAMVPATAIDLDHPGVPVGTAFTLRSPPEPDLAKPVFVSPLTDAVHQVMVAAGSTDAAAAAAQVQAALGLTSSPLDNFIEKRTSGTPEEQADAQKAATFAQVLTEIKKEIGSAAEDAGVSAESKEALISVTVVNTLNTLTSAVENNAGTAAALGQQLVQQLGITAATVAQQAAQATLLMEAAADTVASTPGPFVWVRDLRYTDANNWSYRLFTGDDVPQADGARYAHEIRRQRVSGNNRPFNRDASFYDEAAGRWYECPSDGYQAAKTTITASGTSNSLFCHTFSSTARRTDESIAGATIRSVLERVRGSGVADYATWGADPALVPAGATFPAGSLLRSQMESQLANPDSHSLSNKVRVLAPQYGPNDSVAFNTWPFAATLEQVVARYYGSFTAVADADVTGNIADQLAEIGDASVTDPTLQKKAFYRVAFQASGASHGLARYYLCRRNEQSAMGNTNTRTCARIADGSYQIETKADARVLRLAGIPPVVTGYTGNQRLYVERAGTVFYGSRNLLQTSTTFRLNGPAWAALRAELAGVTAHTDPVAPQAPDAAKWLRDMRDLDNGFSYRVVNSTGTGSGSFSEVRVTYDNTGAVVPFARNRLFWDGSAWRDSEETGICPSNGVNMGTWSSAPRESGYCALFRESSTGFDASIAGKTFATLVAEARLYPARDSGADFRNWGPTVLNTDPEYNDFTNGTFPAGSVLRYQVQTTITSADTIVADAPVMVGSPQAALASFAGLAALNGGYGPAANGANTLGIFSYTGSGAPAAGTTGVKRLRAGFSGTATGGSVKFFSCDVASGTGLTTNCIETSNSTYAVTAQGGKNVLRFAAQPAEMTDVAGMTRLLVEHNGAVYPGSRGIVGARGYSLRLNQTAYEALLTGVFGLSIPTVTQTVP